MADMIDLRAAGPILQDMVAAIVGHAAMLNELDGATGDGDHGVNMSKGFRLTGQKLAAHPQGLGEGDRKSTRLNSSHSGESRMPSSA